MAFVAASFPYADTISALVAPIKMKVVFQQQEMNFPLGARFEDVCLLSSGTQQLLFRSPNVTVAPRLSWLLFGRPCLRIRAELYGGMLDASIYRSAAAAMVDFHVTSLDLARMVSALAELEVTAQAEGNENEDAPRQFGITLSGELSGGGSLRVMGADIAAGRANIIVFGNHVRAAIVDGLPALDLGVVRGNLRFERGIATLEDLSAAGSDGEVKAQGEIRLAPDIAHSIVRLTVSLTPTAKGRANFGLLLNMLPHTPSRGPYRVEGILSSPSVT